MFLIRTRINVAAALRDVTVARPVLGRDAASESGTDSATKNSQRLREAGAAGHGVPGPHTMTFPWGKSMIRSKCYQY